MVAHAGDAELVGRLLPYHGRRILRIDDVTAPRERAAGDPDTGFDPRFASYLAVPVVGRSGRRFGSLVLAHDRIGAFTEEHEQLISGVASTAAIADGQRAALRDAQRLIKALEASNRELDQFAYVASHDLKAPLRGIANLAQWIEEDLGDRPWATSRSNMELLRGRVRRLEALIDGILAYSRAGRVRGKRDRGRRRRAGARGARAARAAAPARESCSAARCRRSTPSACRCSRSFMNLIGNALKHAARPDARVDRRRARRGRRLRGVRVADNGPGIAPEYHERIWGIFQTLEAPRQGRGHGHRSRGREEDRREPRRRAWVESAPGAGATFRFTWPSAAESRERDGS